MRSLKKELLSSIRRVRQYNIQLSIPILFDLLFVMLYAFVNGMIFERVKGHLSVISIQLSSQSDRLVSDYANNPDLFSLLAGMPEVQSSLWSIIYLTIIMIISLYVLYVVLQSFSWQRIYHIAGKKLELSVVLKRFARINLLWLLFFVIYWVVSFAMAARDVITQSPVSASSTVVPMVMLLILGYFILISYGKLNRKKTLRRTFSHAFSDYRRYVPMYIFIIVVLLAVNYLINLIPAINLRLVFEVFILLPLITWIKIFVVRVVS